MSNAVDLCPLPVHLWILCLSLVPPQEQLRMHSEKLTQAEIEKGSAESKIQQLNSLVEAKNTELAMVLSVYV